MRNVFNTVTHIANLISERVNVLFFFLTFFLYSPFAVFAFLLYCRSFPPSPHSSHLFLHFIVVFFLFFLSTTKVPRFFSAFSNVPSAPYKLPLRCSNYPKTKKNILTKEKKRKRKEKEIMVTTAKKVYQYYCRGEGQWPYLHTWCV